MRYSGPTKSVTAMARFSRGSASAAAVPLVEMQPIRWLLIAMTMLASTCAAAFDPSDLSVEGSVSIVAQRVNNAGAADAASRSRLNYRGDLGATLAAGKAGAATGEFFAHLRFGQGEGPTTLRTYTGAINSLAFDAGDPGSNTFAILAELYYRLRTPDEPGSQFSLVVGKIDPFGFFDQNEVADDESDAFLNNVFVHNPLLDSGGDIGGDDYGFTPGIIGSWERRDTAGPWLGLSIGVFGAGEAASFDGPLSRPLSIAQLSYSPRDAGGRSMGNWRVYLWHNPQVDDIDGRSESRSGWGLSADHRLSESLTAFGRYGHRTRGSGSFDQALTVGLELDGALWSKDGDGVGLAIARLKGNDDGQMSATDETVLEAFYRLSRSKSFSLTPHWQVVRNPGGDAAAASVHVIGLRATLTF